jgi:hypothetical protein
MVPNEENVKGIFSELVDHEYKVENVSDNEEEWVLQVSKVESLTPDKLHRRNVAFNELAKAYNAFYDGWDVGQVV